MVRAGIGSLALAALLALAPQARAQLAVSQAIELERLGRYEDAATAYRIVLGKDTVNIAALLGLERTLGRLGRLDDLLPHARRAAAAAPGSAAIRAVEIRALAAVAGPDSAAAAVRRWASETPGDEAPYREWVRGYLARGDLLAARRALEAGRQVLGGPPILSLDAAQVATMLGDWTRAAREWRAALTAEPGLFATAEANLGLVPPEARGAVIATLSSGEDRQGSRLAGHLLLGWGRAEQGWAVFSRALPSDPRARATWLRAFADRARLVRSPETSRVLGLALERLAEVSPPREAARWLGDAARAYGTAGEPAAARRAVEKLGQLGGDATSAAGVQATVIALLADEGRVGEADSLFAEWRARLTPEDRTALLDRLAWAWLRAGRLDRARAVVGVDSSIAGLELSAWTALYGGALREAVERFRAAGPRADARATHRTQVLALVQRIERDSFPLLGEALWALARGDTARAVQGLLAAGESLPLEAGGGDLLVLAADLDANRGEAGRAESTYRAILRVPGTGAAHPAAELGLARLLLARGGRDEAVKLLEHLILTYPQSALVPQARRELDRARGLIPDKS